MVFICVNDEDVTQEQLVNWIQYIESKKKRALKRLTHAQKPICWVLSNGKINWQSWWKMVLLYRCMLKYISCYNYNCPSGLWEKEKDEERKTLHSVFVVSAQNGWLTKQTVFAMSRYVFCQRNNTDTQITVFPSTGGRCERVWFDKWSSRLDHINWIKLDKETRNKQRSFSVSQFSRRLLSSLFAPGCAWEKSSFAMQSQRQLPKLISSSKCM